MELTFLWEEVCNKQSKGEDKRWRRTSLGVLWKKVKERLGRGSWTTGLQL
jgi:hypothetical protein